MNEICTDNRFELITKYKTRLVEATNIETDQEEMKVIDNILFRFWQMRWLDKLELPSAQQWIPCSERLPEEGKAVIVNVIIENKIYDVSLMLIDEVAEAYKNRWIDAWMPLPEPWKGDEA